VKGQLAVKELLDGYGVGIGVVSCGEGTDRTMVDGQIPAWSVEGNPNGHRREDEYPKAEDNAATARRMLHLLQRVCQRL
jgi:hypothetical protein